MGSRGHHHHTSMRASAYDVGTKLCIREHLPPQPFTGSYGPIPRPPVDWARWEDFADWEVDRVAFALCNPPIETEPPGPRERILTITGSKTLRDEGGAHILTCFLDDDRSVEYVAKIYDGVYYPFVHVCRGPRSVDCMTWADRDYSIKAWAYRTMQPVIGGTIVPRYFGSWTFALDAAPPGASHSDAGQQRKRWVRMILIERVQGECMFNMIERARIRNSDDIDYSLLPPEHFRLRVLRNILEAEMAIWWEAAVRHEDLEPRNVMVKPDGSVVIIDFNQAYIYDFTDACNYHPRRIDPSLLPPSPIEEYWSVPGRFANSVEDDGPWGEWVPKSWLQNKDLAAEWLVDAYRDSPRFRKPSEWWLNRSVHQDKSPKILRLLESLGRKPVGAGE
ncbi:hypothetical protein VTI74DRAFT_10621 [Chaetomium olivicolor]